jgi:hypothetical protein
MRILCLRLTIACLAAAACLAATAPLSAATGAGKTYLLAVGICPPYRSDIPTEACDAGVDQIAQNLGDAFDIAPENIVRLTGAKATGTSFLSTLSTLGERLKEDDRLILYLIAHGDTFGQWAGYYGGGTAVAEISQSFFRPDDYVLVFWTQDEPTVPALALAQKDWLTVDEIVEAVEALPARVALILDSCSSGRTFTGFHLGTREFEQIDFVLASAGSEQISNLSPAKTMPLFTEELVNAIDLPSVDTFGEAVAHAQMTTVLRATALCSALTLTPATFAQVFPGVRVPVEATHDGLVSPPLWLCSQVPSVADFSGEMSDMPLYRRSATQ